jgi:Lrp/AsnC family transcriptional regulator, leucine-responsive regulatory protein
LSQQDDPAWSFHAVDIVNNGRIFCYNLFSQLDMLHPKLDDIDLKILAVLQEDARITNVDLASQVHLSPSPCLARVKRLERDGVIQRYLTLVDPKAVGVGVSVFVQIRLKQQVEPALRAFEQAVASRPEVMECYLMTGASDYLLRVSVTDLDEFQDFVTSCLAKTPGVATIHSSVALKQVKYKTALPLQNKDER